MKTIFHKIALILSYTFILFSNVQAAQLKITQPDNQTTQNTLIIKDSVYAVVEKMPQYIGGDAARIEFLKQNVQYPDEAQKNQEQGRVVVQFVIGSNGQISNAKVVKNAAPSLDQEALRVVNLLPDWIPGEQNGKKVPVYQVMLIPFKYVPSELNDSLKWEVNSSTLIVVDSLKMPYNFNIDVLQPDRISKTIVLKPFPEETKSKLIAQYGPLAENGVILIKSKKLEEIHSLTDSLYQVIYNDNEICKDSIKMPEYPGGKNALASHIFSLLKYPVISMETGVQGKVTIRFVVDKTGKVKVPIVFKSVDPLLDNEALRVVKTLSDFIPAEKCGEKVNVYYYMPFVYKLYDADFSSDPKKVWKRNDKTIILLDGEKLPSNFDLSMLNMKSLSFYKTIAPKNRTTIKKLVAQYGEDAVNGVIVIKSNGTPN